jgi:hypothetical protein
MQTPERVTATLRAHEAELRQARLRSISLFGSVARILGSSVDLLPEPLEKRRLQDQINRTACVPSKHDPAASLVDIVENLERIEDHVAGLDRESFGADTLRRDAVERCLERIREPAF